MSQGHCKQQLIRNIFFFYTLVSTMPDKGKVTVYCFLPCLDHLGSGCGQITCSTGGGEVEHRIPVDGEIILRRR